MGAIIFDLDGTLIDTSADLIDAANAVFKELLGTTPLSHPKDKMIAFHGGRAMLREGCARLGQKDGAEFADAHYQMLIESYAENIACHSRFFEGAIAALGTLRAQGHRLGLCTNKPHHLAVKLLDELEAAHWFDAIIGADYFPYRKPDPRHYFGVLEMMECDGPSLLVGDTITDLKTAQAAKVPCVLCDFGALEPDYETYDPKAIIKHFDDLPATVASILSKEAT